MAQASRDENFVTTLLAVSSVDGVTPVVVYADPVTHRLLTDASGGGGSGTVTQLDAGTGILLTPDPITTTGSIALVTSLQPLATLGTANQLVRVNAGATALEYFTAPFMTNPMTTGGDIIYGGASGTPTRLANGSAGQVLTSAGTTLPPTWETPASAGLTVGTTTITGGTTTRILYDNAGVLGEYTITGSGTQVAMATAPTFVTSITTPSVLATANDSGALGASGTAFSDLFLASGAVINFDAGNSVITHSSAVLTVSTGDLHVTTAGTNTASVVTVGGTQTLTAKTLTNPTINGATLNGDVQYDGTPNTDDTWNGASTNTFNAGATVAQFEAVYLSSSSTWLLTDADASSTAGAVMIALAGEAGTNTNPLRVILPNSFVRNDAWNWTVGGLIYLSTTPGALTQTAPNATDDVVRICGYAVTADVMYWNPSNDFVTIV